MGPMLAPWTLLSGYVSSKQFSPQIVNFTDTSSVAWHRVTDVLEWLSGEPDYFGRNEISSGGDLSHYSSASLY